MSVGTNARDWLRRLGDLNVARSKLRGPAPHKPLLLLAVMTLLEDGLLASNRLDLTPELVLRFQDLWKVVAPRCPNRGDIRMPFYHIASARDQVWRVFDGEGRPATHKGSTRFAIIPDDLLALLGDSTFRTALRRRLVATYFTPIEQVELMALLGFETELNESELDGYRTERESFRLAKIRGRSHRFSSKVPSLYLYTCALTGYRLTLAGDDPRQLVEAAHIEAHRVRGNDELENGLALTPTAHALFDMGLWSVTDDLRVLVKPASAFHESASADFSLRAADGRPLHLVSGSRIQPGREHLAWHRATHGFAR